MFVYSCLHYSNSCKKVNKPTIISNWLLKVATKVQTHITNATFETSLQQNSNYTLVLQLFRKICNKTLFCCFPNGGVNAYKVGK